jgi:hypothetical protein
VAPSLVPRKWRRTVGFAMAASGFAQEGQLAHNNNSLDPMCGLCSSKVLQAILRRASYLITKRRINILTAANVMSICLVHDQIRTGVRSDVAGGC